MNHNPHQSPNSNNDLPDINNNDDGDMEMMEITSESDGESQVMSEEEDDSSSYEEISSEEEEEIQIVEDRGSSRAPTIKQPVILFEQLEVGHVVFAPETLKDADRPWHAAVVNDIRERYGKFMITVTFSTSLIKGHARILNQKDVRLSFKHLAYFDEKPKMCKIIPKGVRVVAQTTFTKSLGDRFYSGIIAEIPSQMNKDRYLVFFDTGAVKYIKKENARMICIQEPNAWSDCSIKIQMFVKKFLAKSPYYPLARRTRVLSIIQVEWNGFWWPARVTKVDCSLIKVELIDNYLKFWLYRGSSRILENNKKAQRKINEYKLTYDKLVESGQKPEPLVYCEEFEGKVEKHQVPQKYLNRLGIQNNFHTCSPKSCSPAENVTLPKNLSPLCRPLYFGWDRQIENQREQSIVYYVTPCGRKMCNFQEIDKFLKITESSMGIDVFCFDVAVDCLAEFKPRIEPYIYEQDISNGLEQVIVERINSVDKEPPPKFFYMPNNVEDESVKSRRANDKEFLLGCDCVDNCSDQKNCSCCKLTRENFDGFGYDNKRLFDECVSGIFECNPSCKCSASCHNRVVQQGLQYRLQVFKTSKKGYAVRAMQDIPHGAFVCLYSGELMSEEVAFHNAMQAGDDYLFNVDMIENYYTKKKGYEPTVIEPEVENPNKDNSKKKPENGDSVHRKFTEEDEDEKETEILSERVKMFGQDEKMFVVDSMRLGNIGRFLSHSCDPNVWPNNIFTDTHDLRFPICALFTSKSIKCGSELTWNYNYQVGSVEGKEMTCSCGAVTCKRRLL